MSYIENYHHVVFRTKYSKYTIPQYSRPILLAYLRKVSEDMGAKVIAVNSHLNHVHLFADLPGNLDVSTFTQKVKQTSSKVFNGHLEFPGFEGWARKFGSISKSRRDKEIVSNYIENQDEHHRHKTFREELEDMFGPDFFKDPYNRRDWLDEPLNE